MYIYIHTVFIDIIVMITRNEKKYSDPSIREAAFWRIRVYEDPKPEQVFEPRVPLRDL